MMPSPTQEPAPVPAPRGDPMDTLRAAVVRCPPASFESAREVLAGRDPMSVIESYSVAGVGPAGRH